MLATVGLAGVALAGGAAASPEVETARARAEALNATVTGLQEAAEVATEDYNGAQAELAQAVSTDLSADQSAHDARAEQVASARAANERARALYMSGGQLGLYANVLDGQDVGDVLTRVQAVRALLRSDTARVRTGSARVTATQASALTEERRYQRQRVLAARSASAARRVRALLHEAEALLARADEEVRRLAAVEAARAEAAAAAAAAAEFAASPAQDAAASSAATGAIDSARAMLGRPYQWGAVGPEAFDCSGLTGWAYRSVGVDLPRTSRDQWFAGPHVPLTDLAPGDLLFWATDRDRPATIHHVALYLGRGTMIHAPRTGDVVREAPVLMADLIGAVRPA